MTTLALDPRANWLLAALPDDERERWRERLEPVDLSAGQVLYGIGEPPREVLFPTTAIIALVAAVPARPHAEIAVVGRDGVVGVSLALGEVASPHRAVVRIAGQALRLDGGILQPVARLAPMLLLMRYAQALFLQMAQTALCLREHSLEQQLCRWLLLSLDRLQGSEMASTHQQAAAMLGVAQEELVAGVLMLQGAGLIRWAPAGITILDRPGLTLRSCACYAAVSREHDRLRPAHWPAERAEGNPG